MQIRSGSHSLSSQLALPHAFTLLTVDIFWIQWASETGWTQIILHSSGGTGQWASGTGGTVTPRASLIQLCSLRKFTPNGHALTGPLEFMFFNYQIERDSKTTHEESVFHPNALHATNDHIIVTIFLQTQILYLPLNLNVIPRR